MRVFEVGKDLRDVWLHLTEKEARELLLSLQYWLEDVEEGRDNRGWHTHIEDGDREFTLAIDPPDTPEA